MPRRARNPKGGLIYHVLNRGNCRMRIFFKDGDYRAFLKILAEGQERCGMRVLGVCLMPNHWHLVLWPRKDGDLSRFVQWVATTHVRRWREHRQSGGEGHLYQGRYKSFPVQNDEHFLTLMRYVEANAKRAELVEKAEEWEWGSLWQRRNAAEGWPELSDWPVERPGDWAERVNRGMKEKMLEELRVSVGRGRPFGEEKWVKRTAGALGLESSLRDPWRPKKGSLEQGKEK